MIPSGPLFKAMKPGIGDLILEFDYADGLMTAAKQGYAAPVPTPGVAPKHFAIAGADRAWFWADAEIRGNTIVLSSDKVPEPVAVRYAFRAYPDGVNVYNAAGLPMVPFRTDSW
jgi:sialate O-acetylesterase